MPKFEAVLFDCDGVLVDSEPITNEVLRVMLGERGWHLTLDECMRIFTGKAVKDETALIEARTGQPLTPEWFVEFRARRNLALERDLLAIRHILSAMQTIASGYGRRIACASGADKFKVELQLNKVGLMPFFGDRIFSGHDLPRSKPHPDVYLAAAAYVGASASQCAVVEDTVTGVQAGVAAGATVLGYSQGNAQSAHAQALLAAGASLCFASMQDLPALVMRLG
jgi:HAD superfamily hydrolase (TIGR01509 family)